MNQKKGFTLIEILIVVAIIAILASVVLVGLGPTQQAGRDARRISDLSEVQNGLELYYNKYGIYPGSAAGVAQSPGATWAALGTAIVGANVGVTTLPSDPSKGASYQYWYGTNNISYVVGAHLENSNNSVFVNYAPPNTASSTPAVSAGAGTPADCLAASSDYCKTL
jgi:prepilin-type N-terminal cleavage/methylation domain-containing protein